MPPPILPAAPCCPTCQNLTNQRKPETIANVPVNKHVKGTMLSNTVRKTGILADKSYSFSDRVCLPCATKIINFSEGLNLIVSTLKAVSTPQNYWTERMSKTGHSPATEKRSSPKKSVGSRFCSRISENEDVILNIDNMVSLEHSIHEKFVMS